MPQTIELPDDLADALHGEATRAGLSLNDFTVRLLTAVPAYAPSEKITPAELLARWIDEGLLSYRPDDDRDSPEIARELRENAPLRGR